MSELVRVTAIPGSRRSDSSASSRFPARSPRLDPSPMRQRAMLDYTGSTGHLADGYRRNSWFCGSWILENLGGHPFHDQVADDRSARLSAPRLNENITR